MTADELRKLAGIAGVSPIDEIDVIGRTALFTWVPNPFKSYTRCEWQPHLRIEQAMMVADAFVEWELRKTSEKRYYSFVVSDDLENYYDATEDTASLSLCRAALAAKEGQNEV